MAVGRHLAALLTDTPIAHKPEHGSPATGDASTVHGSGAGRTIAAYVPFGREPGGDLPEFLSHLLPAAAILLPVVLPDRDLDWVAFQPGELPARPPSDFPQPALSRSAQANPEGSTSGSTSASASGGSSQGSSAAGAAGGGAQASALREPTGPRLGAGAIERADVIIVPALAVDRRGNRLGRGGGSYDRALARVGPDTLIVALLHDGELLDEVPAEPHDRPVQLVITPNGRYRTAI